MGGLNNGHLFSHCSRDQESHIKVSTGLVSGKVSLLDLYTNDFLQCIHPFLCVYIGEKERDIIYLLIIRTQVLSYQDPTSFNLTSLKGLSSNAATLEG